MSKRLVDWIEELGISDYEIACGLDNGDVERPEWLASSPCTGIGYAIWDNEESDGSTHLYNLNLDTDDKCEECEE